MIRIASVALVLAAACGSKSPTPAPVPRGESSGESHAPGDHMAAEHGELADIPPELKTFHDLLAPRWHAAQGAQRIQDTCAALPEFHADADAVAKATPPRAANADTWTTGTRQLVAAIGELDTTCKTKDPSSFEAAFQKVHDSFHGLLAAAGMTHGEDHDHDASGEHHDM